MDVLVRYHMQQVPSHVLREVGIIAIVECQATSSISQCLPLPIELVTPVHLNSMLIGTKTVLIETALTTFADDNAECHLTESLLEYELEILQGCLCQSSKCLCDC